MNNNLTEYIDTFTETIANDDDTISDKEAFVNLLKIKTDLSDKQAEITDLMTHVVLKENNIINMSENIKRYLLKHIDCIQKKKKGKNE